MKISHCLILFLLLPLASKEQIYVPFPDSNAVWQEVLLPYPPGPMPAYWEHNQYTISGDTLINNILYDKLFKTEFNVNCSLIFTGPYFAGGIRNNSLERKVFYYDPDYSEEFLLYDFTLQVGDTVPLTFNNISYPDLLVDSIDSVLIGLEFRKRFFYLEPFMGPIQVIEGIGAETGLLDPMYNFEVIHYLRCFHQNDSSLWLNPRADSCNLETDTCLTISIPEHIKNNELPEIYPNPASDHIYLQFSSENPLPLGEIRMEIYNMFGQKVGEITIPDGREVFPYNVSGLSVGLYIYLIRDNQRIIRTGKFIVNR